MGRRPGPVSGEKIEVRFRLSLPQRKRVEHHASRLGVDMSDIVREGTLTHLDNLDQKEMIVEEARRLRERRDRPRSSTRTPQGLGIRKDSAVKLFPEKIKNSFRRFAEYLEQAPNEVERAARAQTITAEIEERLDGNRTETDAAVKALTEFLRAREEAKRVPSGKITINEDAVAAGDVEEES
jgi:predicted DNA-binding protein